MCGRIVQSRYPIEYMEALRLSLVSGISPEPIGRYNVPPGTRVQLLHQDDDGLRMEPVSWGYTPFWAKGKRPPAKNARVETAASGKLFKSIWSSGRAIVPADGWYEWKTHPDESSSPTTSTTNHVSRYFLRRSASSSAAA